MDTNISDADLAVSGIGQTLPLGLPDEGNGFTEPPHHFQEHRPTGTYARNQSPPGPGDETRHGGEPPESPRAHNPIGAAPDGRIRTSSTKSRRGPLLTVVALALLIGSASAGYVYREPLRTMAVTAGVIPTSAGSTHKPPSIRAPALAASEAVVPAKPPVSAAGHSGTRQAGTPIGEPGAAAPRQQLAERASTAPMEVQEITRLRSEPPLTAAPVGAAVAMPPMKEAATEAPSTVVPAGPRVLRSETAASKPVLVANAPVAFDISLPWHMPQPVDTPAPAPPPTPRSSTQLAPTTPPTSTPVAPVDPTVTAATIQAAPLSTVQQVEVLSLLKNLGAQLRDTRTEVTQLRATVVQLSGTVETKINDFDGRLSMAEATTILQSSARAGEPSAPLQAPSMLPAPAGRPASVVVPSGRAANRLSVPADALNATVTPAAERRLPKDYTIRGASPGLAVVAAVNAAPGSPSVFEVAVGDALPGLGRVKRVYQRGTTWAVDTDGGAIQ